MRKSRIHLSLAMIVLLSLHFTTPVGAQEVLTNEKIVELVEARLSDDTILTLIANSNCSFKTDVDSIMALKEKRVSEEVIRAMIEKSRLAAPANPSFERSTRPSARPGPAPSGRFTDSGKALPSEVGVYYRKNDGQLVEIEPEIVTWKEGGVFKKIATMGITRGHMNGVVRGPLSKYILKGDEELYIRTLEGTSASEYQLLHLWEKKDRREFRVVTGGVFHASGEIDKNAVYFEPTKIAPRIYKFKLPEMAPGEYGLLAPGGMRGETTMSSGKMYTFSVGR